MPRDFDGSNDNITFGSDASIDDYGAVTISFWFVHDSSPAGFARAAVKADSSDLNGWTLIPRHQSIGAGNVYSFERTYSGATGRWYVNTSLSAGQRYHGALTHDGTTAAAVLYRDGASQTVTTHSTASGTLQADAANNLRIGESNGGIGDYDGRMAAFVYHNAVLSAADINRAKWWGRPIGGLKVYHPLWTDKVANEGTATADGTVTGATVASFATPTQRPSSAMMGLGVGW